MGRCRQGCTLRCTGFIIAMPCSRGTHHLGHPCPSPTFHQAINGIHLARDQEQGIPQCRSSQVAMRPYPRIPPSIWSTRLSLLDRPHHALSESNDHTSIALSTHLLDLPMSHGLIHLHLNQSLHHTVVAVEVMGR